MLDKISKKLKLDMKIENSQTFFHKIAFFVKKGLDFGFNKCYYNIASEELVVVEAALLSSDYIVII